MDIILVAVVIGVVVALQFSGFRKRFRGHRSSYKRYPRPSGKVILWSPPAAKADDGKVTVDEQLSALRATTVVARRPINKSAYRVLLMIERTLRGDAPRARVLAEVGMGAFLSTGEQRDRLPNDKMAFGAFNSKRVDFLVIDAFGEPCFAVEYQGNGHHLGSTSAGRDVLKREALRLGRVELVEIHAHTSEEEALVLLSGAVRRMNTRSKTKAIS
jgi:hypothetical protein